MHSSLAPAVASRSLMPPNPLLTREGGGVSRPALFSFSVLTTMHGSERANFSHPFLSVQTKGQKKKWRRLWKKILPALTAIFHPLLAACSVIHFCRTDPNNNRDLYRNEFVPGVLASFFGDYLQGDEGMVKYITTRDLMPVPVGQLYVNITCTTTP